MTVRCCLSTTDSTVLLALTTAGHTTQRTDGTVGFSRGRGVRDTAAARAVRSSTPHHTTICPVCTQSSLAVRSLFLSQLLGKRAELALHVSRMLTETADTMKKRFARWIFPSAIHLFLTTSTELYSNALHGSVRYCTVRALQLLGEGVQSYCGPSFRPS